MISHFRRPMGLMKKENMLLNYLNIKTEEEVELN